MAALTATVTDTTGVTDTGVKRNVGVQVEEATGVTDAGNRQNITAAGTDPAGLRDAATPAGGSAPTHSRTVTDDAGLNDAFSKQDIADELTETVGLADITSVPPPPPPPPTPPPPPDPGSDEVNVADLPRMIVQMAIGGTTPDDPNGPGAFVLGRSQLGISTLGAIAWVDVAADVLSLTTTPSPAGITDSASPASMTLVVDNQTGVYDPDNPATPYAIDVGQHVRWRLEWGGVIYPQFYGYIDDITPDYGVEPTVTFACSDGLSILGRARIQEITPSFDGDRTDQRLGRILSDADWPATLRLLEPGQVQCQADTYGDFALPLAQRIVDTELGEQYVDGDGRYVFLNRFHVYIAARSTTVQALFSDAGTDIDMEGVNATRSRGELFNQASITRNGDGALEQFYEDTASRLKYGPQTFPRSAGTMLQTDGAANALAHWIVARFKQVGVKISDLSIDATAQGMWDTLLPLQRFDRVRIQRTYGTAAVVRDVQVLVEGIAWSVTPGGSWTATITTRPADNFHPFVLGISRLGTGVLG